MGTSVQTYKHSKHHIYRGLGSNLIFAEHLGESGSVLTISIFYFSYLNWLKIEIPWGLFQLEPGI
jgi:hypothetical protein